MAALAYSVMVEGNIVLAGTEETPELRKHVTNPAAWGEEAAADEGSEPPRAGRGSGLEPWKLYAEALGLTVEDDASRDDVVALVDAAKA